MYRFTKSLLYCSMLVRIRIQQRCIQVECFGQGIGGACKRRGVAGRKTVFPRRCTERCGLRKAIDGTGYSLKKEGTVRVLLAADLAPRQKKALNYRFNEFPSGTQSMAMFALTLTTWIVAAMDNMGGAPAYSVRRMTNKSAFRICSPPPRRRLRIELLVRGQGVYGFLQWTYRPAENPVFMDCPLIKASDN